MLGNMGISEWAIILVIVLIFFGPKNLPKLAQSIGKSVRELKNGLSGIQDDLKDTLNSPPESHAKPKAEVKSHTEEQDKTESESHTPTV